jgi:serine protein kinase
LHAELPGGRHFAAWRPPPLMEHYAGDWSEVMSKHVRIRRFVLSEQDRLGIGTFRPKDEKDRDSTELTGNINYRKIAVYGSDSDPRAFNFDGEFNIASRGVLEFIEVLKLDAAFLIDQETQEKIDIIKSRMIKTPTRASGAKRKGN